MLILDVIEVRWRLSTPDDWKVKQIKKILEDRVASTSSFGTFNIKFVYDGSLVIQMKIKDRSKLKAGKESFFRDFVKICQIETNKKQTVEIEVTFSDAEAG